MSASCGNRTIILKTVLYAEIDTSKGKILISLEFEKNTYDSCKTLQVLAEGKN